MEGTLDRPGQNHAIKKNAARIAINESDIDTAEAAIDTLEAKIIAPHYDTGWIAQAQGNLTTYTHNLGGDATNKYIIEFAMRSTASGRGITNYNIGEDDGWFWLNSTANTIQIYRTATATNEEARLKIWIHA